MKLEWTQGSETSAYKIQTSGICPEENIQLSERGERFKSRIVYLYIVIAFVRNKEDWKPRYNVTARHISVTTLTVV